MRGGSCLSMSMAASGGQWSRPQLVTRFGNASSRRGGSSGGAMLDVLGHIVKMLACTCLVGSERHRRMLCAIVLAVNVSRIRQAYEHGFDVRSDGV